MHDVQIVSFRDREVRIQPYHHADRIVHLVSESQAGDILGYAPDSFANVRKRHSKSGLLRAGDHIVTIRDRGKLAELAAQGLINNPLTNLGGRPSATFLTLDGLMVAGMLAKTEVGIQVRDWVIDLIHRVESREVLPPSDAPKVQTIREPKPKKNLSEIEALKSLTKMQIDLEAAKQKTSAMQVKTLEVQSKMLSSSARIIRAVAYHDRYGKQPGRFAVTDFFGKKAENFPTVEQMFGVDVKALKGE